MSKYVAICIKDGFMDAPDGRQFCKAGKTYEVLKYSSWILEIKSEFNHGHGMDSEFAAEYFNIVKEEEAVGIGFDLALQYLRQGFRVTRVGWNGKGMWLVLIDRNSYEVHNMNVCSEVEDLLPWIGMKTADNKFVPWLASQTDILANDYVVIDSVR